MNALMILFLGILFVFTIGLLITVFMNLWTGVPSLPTPLLIVRAMIDLAELKGDETIVDLGAGDGRLLIEAARRYPGISARGWEIIPTVWLVGKVRLFSYAITDRLFGRHGMSPLQRVRLILGDALKADIADADVVFLYLFPSVIERLMTRFETELKPGTRIVSHTFTLPGKTPVSTVRMQGYMGETPVYLYSW